jgi:acyl transferase domain-containing protein
MEEAMDTMGPLGAIRRFSKRRQFAALTALTPNFGYLQSAVGIADLTVMVQALQARLIPPLPHFDTPTDLMDLVDSPFYIPTALEPWPESANGRRLGIIYTNGFGGANSMLAVGPAPEPVRRTPAAGDAAAESVYCASASDAESFGAKIRDDLALLEAAADADFAAICHSSASRQHVHSRYRLAVTARSRSELVAALTAHLRDGSTPAGAHIGRELTGSSSARGQAAPSTLSGAAAAFARGEQPRFAAFVDPADRRLHPLPRYRLRPTRHWPVRSAVPSPAEATA